MAVGQPPGWRLTISAGTATWQAEGTADRSVRLVAQADEALSAAKTAGKNRVVAHADPVGDRPDE